MDPMIARLDKLREERIAREKARIEKLRELNLKKYNKEEDQPKNFTLNVSQKPIKSEINLKKNPSSHVKNNFHVNGTTKKPVTAPNSKIDIAKQTLKTNIPSKIKSTPSKVDANRQIEKPNIPGVSKTTTNLTKPQMNDKKLSYANQKVSTTNKIGKHEKNTTTSDAKPASNITADIKTDSNQLNHVKKQIPKVFLNKSAQLRKSLAVNEKQKVIPPRKSISQPVSSTVSNQSVFDRLYKPKPIKKSQSNEVEKLHNDPNYLKKIIRNSGLILNNRHTLEPRPKIAVPVRRSISAVHFKRISKSELGNCIHKWSSIGNNLNNRHLKHINEDEKVIEDKVVSAIKSERKKVKFQTPMSNFNTPKPEELQSRLKTWLQKRGKSLDSYHHLQCFGIHHLPSKLKFDTKLYDDENKENIALDSDSDDDSYTANMNDVPTDKWRTASIVSDSVDFNESQNTTLTSNDVVNTDEVLLGALNDLTELLKEGFDWEQCARWLRAIRERFPSAPHSAAYWECRAALEERRGDLPASVQCWEEAIAKGTEHSVVEASLDQLLDKFMQLKISPNSGKRREVDAKLVDVKNVFKSTIIRFAVQQAKLRQSGQFEAPKYTVTPVRRSARLSAHWSARRTPLQVCTTVRQADEIVEGKTLFVPNHNLYGTP